MDLRLDPADAPGCARSEVLDDGQRKLSVIVMATPRGTRAYLNSCPHAGVRLDWNAGTLMDDLGHYLRCSLHGALFEPGTGRCVAGPCKGASLVALDASTAEDGSLVIHQVEKIPGRAGMRR